MTWSLARDVATSATWRQADRTEAATGRESLEWQAEETLVKDGLTVARARAHAIVTAAALDAALLCSWLAATAAAYGIFTSAFRRPTESFSLLKGGVYETRYVGEDEARLDQRWQF